MQERAGEIKNASKGLDIEWKISNFNISKDIEEAYYSPSFSFAGKSWSLWIYPNGRSEIESAGLVKLYLVSKSKMPSKNFKVTLGLKNFIEMEDRQMFDSNFIPETTYEAAQCVPRSELLRRKSEFFPSNALIVLCTLEHLKSAENSSVKCSYCKEHVDAKDISAHEKRCVDKPIKCPECSDVVALKNWYDHECQMAKSKGEVCSLEPFISPRDNKVLHDFKELFLKKEDCDVIMKVQGQEFSAHRNILKARSSVFASTFRSDMKEKATGVVDIEDCDPSSFSDFLCFLYCGDTENISEENVFSLFTAADKYDVPDLRENCMGFIKNNLFIDTFCDTMALALRHSEEELVKLSTDFFLENAVEIIKTVEWQLFLAENLTVGNELFLKFATSSLKLDK